MSHKEIVVIGGGLAGCEAAWQAAGRGCRVTLFEMKPGRHSPAHRSADLAELVCSNSFKSTSLENASGLLKAELRLCGSLIEEQARRCGVPAGQALAVDRERFAAAVTAEIERHPRINVVREECRDVAAGSITVIATGPLTSEAFSAGLQQLLGNSFLYFHDAIAPIVEEESIDRQKVFRASRYNKGTADYLNCPLTQDEYYAFIEALLAAEKVPLREFESLVPFEGCMPVEIMAGRGIETLAYGPMKPVGLVDPRTERQSYAVVQLRTENQAETLYNLVGFQTRLKWPEQKRVFGLIPGLEQAVFARYGSMHRNTYIHSPQLLLKSLQLQQDPRVFFAGQITGVEGYLESTAMGLMAGLQAAACSQGNKPVLPPPPTTVVGALLSYVTDTARADFQPMNANFGIIEPLGKKAPKKVRKKMMAERALNDMQGWMKKALL